MKPFFIAILLCTVTSTGTISKLEVHENFALGMAFIEKIKNNDLEKMKPVFETNDFQYLNDISSKLVDYPSIGKSIHYSPESNSFIFTTYWAKPIDNGTQWGLYEYLFVCEFQIRRNKQRSVQARIINKKDMKTWWQYHMDTYKEKKYLRKDWGKNYNLIPPPPPPPETTEWFKK